MNGFRATGKTTIGRLLADRLDWQFIDMDETIEKKTGKTITQLTHGGTTWREFRQLEYATLLEFLARERVVVSVGGGTPVNNVVCEETGLPYGAMNSALLHDASDALIVLLTADDDVIASRLRSDEMKKAQVTRPILNEEKAKKIHSLLAKHKGDPEKQKEIIVDEIVADSMQMFDARKPLYAALTDKVVDTGKLSPEEVAEVIMGYLG